MFSVTFLVDDKKLPSALKSVAGLVHNLEVVPVRGAAVTNGEVKSTGSPMANFVLPKKGATITSNDVKTGMTALGLKASSYSYGVRKLLDDKRIKKTAIAGVYQVL